MSHNSFISDFDKILYYSLLSSGEFIRNTRQHIYYPRAHKSFSTVFDELRTFFFLSPKIFLLQDGRHVIVFSALGSMIRCRIQTTRQIIETNGGSGARDSCCRPRSLIRNLEVSSSELRIYTEQIFSSSCSGITRHHSHD